MQQRVIAGRAMVELLRNKESKSWFSHWMPIHLHLLGRFPNPQVRPVVGRAKKHAYFELHDQGFVGHLWGNGSNVVPIKDRKHQLNVFGYIARHKDKGAWVWTFREGIYWREAESGDGGA